MTRDGSAGSKQGHHAPAAGSHQIGAVHGRSTAPYTGERAVTASDGTARSGALSLTSRRSVIGYQEDV